MWGVVMNDVIKWDEKTVLQEIKKACAPKLTDIEFSLFINTAKQARVNPFRREIWAIKFGDRPAIIFIGRDGFRRIARSNKDYLFHFVDAVYENDNFEVTDGKPSHNYTLGNRGKLIGAYCTVYTKMSGDRPFYYLAPIKEYFKGNQKNKNLWDTMPEMMIKKCAEATTLRMAFPDEFNHIYSEAEQYHFAYSNRVYDEDASQDKAYNLEQLLLQEPSNDNTSIEDIEDVDENIAMYVDKIAWSKNMSVLRDDYAVAYRYAQNNKPEALDKIVDAYKTTKQLLIDLEEDD